MTLQKIKDMDRQLPYEISYKTIAFWRNIENGFLWSTFICSILLQTFQINCISHSLDSIKWIANLFNVLNYRVWYIIYNRRNYNATYGC